MEPLSFGAGASVSLLYSAVNFSSLCAFIKNKEGLLKCTVPMDKLMIPQFSMC